MVLEQQKKTKAGHDMLCWLLNNNQSSFLRRTTLTIYIYIYNYIMNDKHSDTHTDQLGNLINLLTTTIQFNHQIRQTGSVRFSHPYLLLYFSSINSSLFPSFNGFQSITLLIYLYFLIAMDFPHMTMIISMSMAAIHD